MKEGIHPAYAEITVTCSCGNTFKAGSSLGRDLHIEVCNACHPVFTGDRGQRLIDTQGRVERFRNKYQVTLPNKNSKENPKKAAEPKP
mgnify:CR=1 FL=1